MNGLAYQPYSPNFRVYQIYTFMTRSKNMVFRLLLLCLTLGAFFFFPRMQTRAQQTGNSLLWQVSGKGMKKPSYLYGTMHSRKRAVFDFGPEVLASLRRCDAFAAELSMDMGTLMQAREMLFLPEEKTLKDYLSPAQYDSVATITKELTGYDLKLLDRMQPFVLSALMQSTGMMQGEMPYFLDQYFFEFAERAGKKAIGLETVEEQGKAFGASTPTDQAVQLMKFVREYKPGEVDSTSEKMFNHYVQQDMEGIQKLFEGTEEESGMNKEQIEALLTKRNQVMANRVDSLMALHSIFVAIGAAHLPGKGGVVALLRTKGYTVVPVPFKFDGRGYQELKPKKKK